MPRRMVDHRSPPSLNIIIVGGSIAGLATAYSLQKAGHKVRVLEKSDGTIRSHGSICSPPNMTRLLGQWGLRTALCQRGHMCTRFIYRDGSSGQLIASVPLSDELVQELQGEFVLIQHGDLWDLLFDLAQKEGALIRFNSTAEAIDCQNVTVTLTSGEILQADVVVGADGPRSLVRSAMFGVQLPEILLKDLSLTFSIATEVMSNDEVLRCLTEKPDWSVWLGDQYTLHGTLIKGKQDYNVTLCFPAEGDVSKFKDDWCDPVSIDDFHINLDRFEPHAYSKKIPSYPLDDALSPSMDIRVRKLFSLADTVTPRLYVRGPFLESSVCDRAQIVLVGEAAHPSVPGGLFNVGLGIEDAQTLGSLFAKLEHLDHVPGILCAYDDIRRSRCNATIKWEEQRRALMTLPQGSMQQQRDAKLRHATMMEEQNQNRDYQIYKQIWGAGIEIDRFAYDAAEMVDDWWTQWGGLLRNSDTSGDAVGAPLIEVDEVSKSAVLTEREQKLLWIAEEDVSAMTWQVAEPAPS